MFPGHPAYENFCRPENMYSGKPFSQLMAPEKYKTKTAILQLNISLNAK
jgi:hypothetical protein